MRISDWSSDVCSSDLVERADHRRRVAAEEGPGQTAVSKDAAGKRAPGGATNGVGQAGIGDGTLEIPVDAVPQVASEGDLGDLRLDVHLHRHHVQALDHVADRLPRARGGAHQQGVGFVDRRHADAVALDLERSEEHTSELQSLMRTSYAV